MARGDLEYLYRLYQESLEAQKQQQPQPQPLDTVLHGWRWYSIELDNLTLVGSYNTEWPRNQLSCWDSEEISERSSAGIYAYKELRYALEQCWQHGSYEAPRAIASCVLWGTVAEHTHGYRAQHARIEALWLDPTAEQRLGMALRQRYGVPTHWGFPDETTPRVDVETITQLVLKAISNTGTANGGIGAGGGGGGLVIRFINGPKALF